MAFPQEYARGIFWQLNPLYLSILYNSRIKTMYSHQSITHVHWFPERPVSNFQSSAVGQSSQALPTKWLHDLLTSHGQACLRALAEIHGPVQPREYKIYHQQFFISETFHIIIRHSSYISNSNSIKHKWAKVHNIYKFDHNNSPIDIKLLS